MLKGTKGMIARTLKPRAWWQALLLLGVGLGLLVEGAIPHDLAVDGVGKASRIEVSENAVHPEEPSHIEARAEMEVHPGCVACLLQMEKRTVPAPAPLPLPPLLAGAPAIPRTAALASQDSSLPGPARAPPASFLSV